MNFIWRCISIATITADAWREETHLTLTAETVFRLPRRSSFWSQHNLSLNPRAVICACTLQSRFAWLWTISGKKYSAMIVSFTWNFTGVQIAK